MSIDPTPPSNTSERSRVWKSLASPQHLPHKNGGNAFHRRSVRIQRLALQTKYYLLRARPCLFLLPPLILQFDLPPHPNGKLLFPFYCYLLKSAYIFFFYANLFFFFKHFSRAVPLFSCAFLQNFGINRKLEVFALLQVVIALCFFRGVGFLCAKSV